MMNITTPPAWLMPAILKAKQIGYEADALREQYIAIQAEITDISLERNRLTDRLNACIEQRNLLARLGADDARVIRNEREIASLPKEIEMLEQHVAGARDRQEAIKQVQGPLNNLARAATEVIRAVQGQSSNLTIGAN